MNRVLMHRSAMAATLVGCLLSLGITGVVGTGGDMAAASSSTSSGPPISSRPPITKPLYPQTQRKVIEANLRKLATCMRSRGFRSFPEPKQNYGNGKVPIFQIGGANGGNFDPTSPQAQSALNACSVGAQKVPGNLGDKAFPPTP